MRRRMQCRRKLLSRARRSRSHRAGDASRPRVHAWSCQHRSSRTTRGGQERSNDPVGVVSRREDFTGCASERDAERNARREATRAQRVRLAARRAAAHAAELAQRHARRHVRQHADLAAQGTHFGAGRRADGRRSSRRRVQERAARASDEGAPKEVGGELGRRTRRVAAWRMLLLLLLGGLMPGCPLPLASRALTPPPPCSGDAASLVSPQPPTIPHP